MSRLFRAIARVSALPGVEAAGIVDYLPLGPNRGVGRRRIRRARRMRMEHAFAAGVCLCHFAGLLSRDGDAWGARDETSRGMTTVEEPECGAD